MCLGLLAGGPTTATTLDAPYPEIQPSNRGQAIEFLSVEHPDWPSLTPQMRRVRGVSASPGFRRSMSILSRRVSLAEERLVTAADGSVIRYTDLDSSLDRLDPTDVDANGRPDLIDAAIQGLAQARSLWVDRYELPDPGPVEVFFAELGDVVAGYVVPSHAPAVRRRIVLDATPAGGAEACRLAIIREFTHAVGLSEGSQLPIEWSTALATWSAIAIDGAPDDRTAALISHRTESLSRGLVTDDLELAAGNAAWFAFIDEFYGPTAVRLTFEELSTGQPVAAALDRAVRRASGSDLPAAFREFHLWSVLTGERSDVHHFPFADRLVAPAFRTHSKGLPTLSVQADPSVFPLGATQIRLTPEKRRGGLRIAFDGEFAANWSIDLILVKHDATKRRVAVAVSDGRGDATVPLDGLDEAWLLIRNVDSAADGPRRYSYAAHVNTAYPYELTTLAAETEGSGVLVAWETASEHGLFAFNVLRTREDGGRTTTVNPIWIPALGTGDSATSYRFLDTGAEPGVSYLYRVEGVTTEGLTSVSPVAVSGRAAPVKRRESR